MTLDIDLYTIPPESSRQRQKKISSLWDVIISMINHWKLCNGRVVAHGLLQMVMPFGKLFFRILIHWSM